MAKGSSSLDELLKAFSNDSAAAIKFTHSSMEAKDLMALFPHFGGLQVEYEQAEKKVEQLLTCYFCDWVAIGGRAKCGKSERRVA
jgi:hypothetical protein